LRDIARHQVAYYEWMDAAECATVDPELFYLTPHENDTSLRVRQAVRICENCPVIEDCLEYAFEIDDQWGILGGKTPTMRSRMSWSPSSSTSASTTLPSAALYEEMAAEFSSLMRWLYHYMAERHTESLAEAGTLIRG